MSLAVFTSTAAWALRLATVERTAEATRQAASVAVSALDLATPEARLDLEVDLREHDELGVGAGQFPRCPWVLWENQRVFHLLQSTSLQGPAVEKLRGLTTSEILEMSPIALLSLLGAQHRVLRAPLWSLALFAGVAGIAIGVALRRGDAKC